MIALLFYFSQKSVANDVGELGLFLSLTALIVLFEIMSIMSIFNACIA